MKDNKIFIHDLIDGIPTTPGKGIKYVETLSYVRFNKFLPGTISRYINDLADSENPYTTVKGIENLGGRYDESATQLVGIKPDVYAGRAFTNMNLASSVIKTESRYTDRVLSLGDSYLGQRIFIVKENANNLDPNTNSSLTFMFRIMLDSSRAATSTDLKAIITIADPVSAASVFCISAPAHNQIRAQLVGAGGTNATTITLSKGVWYTAFFTIENGTTTSGRCYEVADPADAAITASGTGTAGTLISLANPTMYIGYGEVNGGVNAAFPLVDFVSGVHLAELAVFKGKLENETIDLIAQSHLKKNQFSSGINSRPVKRVQQIFDSMTSYPSSQHNSGQRLTDRVITPFDSTKKPTFGKWVSGSGQPDNPQMMLYPEMIPANLYSGSGGFWYNGSYSPYFKTTLPGDPNHVAGNPISSFPTFGYRDFTRTPYENRLVTTGAIVPGAMSLETELLNTVTHENPGSNYYTALGGRVKPFDDNQGGSSFVINKPVSAWPEFDQKLGDVVAIEIPIPTTGDCRMGVDETQGRIASMAYYNFTEARWDRVGFMPGISGSNMADNSQGHGSSSPLYAPYSLSSAPGPAVSYFYNDSWTEDVRQFLVNSCSIGFSGTSGFSILEDEFENALAELPLRGRPTSTYGFPHTDQYVATNDQGINMSDYIDAPFLLQRIAVEIDGEVEESGPSSLGTTIRTRSKWKPRSGPGTTAVDNSVPMAYAGLPGVGQFYAGGGTDGSNSNNVAAIRLGKGLIHNYPTFVGGSTQPGFVDLDIKSDVDALGQTLYRSVTNQANASITPSRNNQIHYSKQEAEDCTNLNTPARIFIPQIAFTPLPGSAYVTAWDRKSDESEPRGPKVNSIKLLFGGISGNVTGSWPGAAAGNIAGMTSTWVQGIDLYDTNGSAMTTDSRVGGVPFWRCDTFFLLRQSPGRERFMAGKAEIYSTNIANNFADLPVTGGFAYGVDASGDTLKPVHSEIANMPFAGGAAWSWRTGANPTLDPVFQRTESPPAIVRIEETAAEFKASTRTTKRELVTYAQLTHYGYAAAEQMLTASMFPSRYYYDGEPGPSSYGYPTDSIIRAGNPAMLSSSAVYTQAMKWSSMGYGTGNWTKAEQWCPGQDEVVAGFPMGRHRAEVTDIHAGSGNGLLWKFLDFGFFRTERGERMDNTTAVSASLYGGDTGNYAPFARDHGTDSVKWTSVSWDWRYQCGTNFNNGGDCLWANGEESSLIVAGADAAGNSDINTFNYAINSAKRSGVPLTCMTYAMVDPATQRWHFTAIQRSGFSIVTSPCLPTIEGNDEQFTKFGTFTKGGILTTEGGVGGWGNCAAPLFLHQDAPITSSKAPVKFNNWLQEGLGRDENIFVSNGFMHKRADIYGGKSGFTILTCSLPHVPSDLTGRFNGDHCIRGTFFEKRLLNAASFRIEAPVRQTPVIISDSSNLFCHITSPGYLLASASQDYVDQLVAATSIPAATNVGFRFNTTPTDDVRFSSYRRWWRCIPLNNAWIGDVSSANSTVNVGSPTTLTSGRRFFTAMAPDKQIYTGSLPMDAPGPGVFTNPFCSPLYAKVTSASFAAPIQGMGFQQTELIGPTMPCSASLGSAAERDSMYVLQPGDKLTLGFQPSLHGSNRGNNTIPANPNVNPYGPWRDGVWQRNEISTASNYDAERSLSRVDSRGQPGAVLRNRNNVNLESLYEPRQSFNIKSSQSAKLILYGTYLRNNKSIPSSTSQQLRSNAVHEVISGGPVIDQFQTDGVSAYSGSYIAQQVTGSVFNNTNDYGSTLSRRFASSVKGRAGSPGVWANPGLRTSGSFQRFVRISDTSEVFYDSLPPNPATMFDIDLTLSGGLNIRPSSGGLIIFSLVGCRSGKLGGSTFDADSDYNGRGNARWIPSFPFEARYKNVKRMVQPPDASFNTTGSIPLVLLPSSSYGMHMGSDYGQFGSSETPRLPGQGNAGYVHLNRPEYIVPRGIYGIQIAEPWNGNPASWSLVGTRHITGDNAKVWIGDGAKITMASLFGFWKGPTKFPNIVGTNYDGGVGSLDIAVMLPHPSGWKYGMMNFRRTASSSVYRYDRYGQLRDQLEQRKYGRFYEYGDDINSVGLQEAAVTCIFVDSEGDPVTDPATTTCNNLSQEMTSSVPYKEGETSRPPILTTEPITISSLI